MAENSQEIITSHSYSHSISKSLKHQKNIISSMPTLFIKNLQRKKQQHYRQGSGTFPSRINPETTERIPGKTRKSNQLMGLMPSPKNVGNVVSVLFRSKKKENQQGHCLVKQGSVSVKCSTSSLLGLFRDRQNGLKSAKGKEKEQQISYNGKKASDNNDSKTAKAGLKIKALTRITTREKDEKRFELCKKKILMGEKCRPLSGTLRYDRKGVLVPEHLT